MGDEGSVRVGRDLVRKVPTESGRYRSKFVVMLESKQQTKLHHNDYFICQKVILLLQKNKNCLECIAIFWKPY